ncbi:hypothetical protein KW785_01765 [Candidatus Parcubacteria bacterium]|nr:hypothetical protein [Candidatus Parcubacteria bacterium]
MRRLLAVISLLVPFSLTAQTEVSGYWAREDKFFPQITYFRSDSIAPHTSYFLWSLVNNGWAENVVGFGTKVKGLSMSAGAGIETVKDDWWRVQGNLYYGSSTNYGYASVETGGSGAWYLFEVTSREPMVQVFDTDRFGIGLRFQRFVGLGPRLEWQLSPHLLVWMVPVAWDVEKRDSPQHFVFTLRYTP